jgi:hypothetical protein
MNEILGTYQAAIHPDRINIWYEPLKRSASKKQLYVSVEDCLTKKQSVPLNFQNNTHNGKLSKIAIKKITRSINYLTYLVPKRRYYTTADAKSGTYFLNFITLTLSSKQIHSDNEIKRSILEPFLNDCRKKFKVRNYIWRAERQENGNIHFHIISDRFIWWNDLRNSWNYFQEQLGYVTRYRMAMREFHKEGFQPREDIKNKWPIHKQLTAWRQGIRTDWNSPNSSDVHSLKSIANVRSYLAKYITKTDNSSVIEGRLWGSSYGLTGITGSREFADGSISDDLEKLMSNKVVKVYKSDYFTVIFFDPGLLNKIGLFTLIASLYNYCRQKFPDYYIPDLFRQAA